MPLQPSIIPLYPHLYHHYRGTAVSFFFRGQLNCHNGETIRDQNCLLATEQRISILPKSIRDTLSVQVQLLPGWKGQHIPSWCGVPCKVGRITLHLGGFTYFPLVRLPIRHKLWMPPFLLLGTEFLQHQQAEIHIRCKALTKNKSCGELILP
jgi:hypothetical protein